MMTDPIASLLTNLRNAYLVKKAVVELPHSKMKEALAKLLLAEGYLEKVEAREIMGSKKALVMTLKYTEVGPAMTLIRRISKPGRRWYVKHEALPTVWGGLGLAIVSTNQGLMTVKQARLKGLGGEIVCEIA